MPMSSRTPRYWLMVATLLVMSLAITVVFVVIGETVLRLAYPENVREYEGEQRRIEGLA
jgi:hypothetical protein